MKHSVTQTLNYSHKFNNLNAPFTPLTIKSNSPLYFYLFQRQRKRPLNDPVRKLSIFTHFTALVALRRVWFFCFKGDKSIKQNAAPSLRFSFFFFALVLLSPFQEKCISPVLIPFTPAEEPGKFALHSSVLCFFCVCDRFRNF